MAGNKKPEVSRKCAACGSIVPKTSLIRIVRQKDGTCLVDKNGKANGRGAYLCRKEGCVEKAFRTGALSRSFRAQIDKDTLHALHTELKGLCEDIGPGSGN